jgi:hypothetical protein
MSMRSAVPSSRCASELASVDVRMPRLSKASTAASHAGVAGMSDFVPAVKRDDAAAQIVISRLGEAGLP